jgi:hypothetical protein
MKPLSYLLFGCSFVAIFLAHPPSLQANLCIQVQPLASITPRNHDFGTVNIGESRSQTFTVSYWGRRMANSNCPCGPAPCDVPASMGISVSSNNGQYSVSPSSFTLGHGGSQTVTVTYSPSHEGAAAAATISLASGSGVATQSLQVTGQGHQLRAIINPSQTSLSFPEQETHGHVAQSFRITNTGDLSLTGSLGSSGEFSVTPATFSLPPGGGTDVTVTFAPTSRGSKSGQVIISSNASNASTLIMNMTGDGVAPYLLITPSTIDFSDIPILETATATLIITNENRAHVSPLNITSLISSHPYYSVSSESFMNIAPGEQQSVTISFNPLVSGVATGTLHVSSNDPGGDVTLGVTGTGVRSQIDVSALSLNFDAIQLGRSTLQVLTVANSGRLPLEITNILSTHNSLIASPRSFVVRGGEERNVNVTFFPTERRDFAETMTIASNDPETPNLDVHLQGRGINPHLSLYTPPFRDVYIGSQKEEIFELENSGDMDLIVTNIVSHDSRFIPLETNITLAPGESYELPVRFIPQSTGSAQGIMTFYTNEYGRDEQNVNLSGNGVHGLDLSVSALEVTQVIQTMDNQIPLVAGKYTLVRAYVVATVRSQANFTQQVRGVDGILRVYRANGEEISGSPFRSSNGPILVTDSFDRNRLNDTLNFYLPKWFMGSPSIASPMAFVFEANPFNGSHVNRLGENNYNNNIFAETLTFHRRVAPIIESIPISYLRRGLPREEAMQAGEEFFKAIFPISGAEIRRRPPIQFNLDVRSHVNELFSLLFVSSQLGDMEPADRVYGWLPEYAVSCGRGLVPGRKGFGDASADCRRTFAHEIGHTYGLCHTGDNCPIDVESLTMTPTIPEVGVDVLARDIYPNYDYSHSYDFMNPGYGNWIHPRRYQTLFDRLASRDVDPAFIREQTLLVGGTISNDDGATLRPLYESQGIPDDPDSIDVSSSEYRLRAVDELGVMMWEMAVPVSEIAGDGPLGETSDQQIFSLVIPKEERMARLEIIDGTDTVLTRLIRSHSAPELDILLPQPGTTFPERLHIEWEGFDADGDSLFYTVLFSANGGETYEVIGLDLEGQTMDYHVSHLPGTEEGWVKIIATDGVHNTIREIGPLRIDAKPPQVAITLPGDGASFAAGSLVVLTAAASDPEDGGLTGASLRWTSDRDGELGTGTELALDDLSLGTHRIQVVAQDTDEEKAVAGITIQISAPQTDPRAVAGLDQVVEEEVPVTLDGSSSFDPNEGDILTYQWTQISGPIIDLNAADQAMAHFMTPAVDGEARLTFRLIIHDQEGHRGQDDVTVTVQNVRYPVLQIVDPQVDFGVVEVGQATQGIFVIRNDGVEPLIVEDFTTSRSIFQVRSRNVTIVPGASATILVTFRPDAEARFEGYVSLQSNSIGGVLTTVVLTGTTLEADQLINDNTVGGSMTVPAPVSALKAHTGGQTGGVPDLTESLLEEEASLEPNEGVAASGDKESQESTEPILFGSGYWGWGCSLRP